MNEVVATRVAWRRRHTPHHYVGTLAMTDAGLRLDGREPATGIELSLSIPFSEIEEIEASKGSADLLAGEPTVVLQLAASEPVLVREVGQRSQQASELARQLGRLLEQIGRPSRAPGATATKGRTR
jgi:hypothetical protein